VAALGARGSLPPAGGVAGGATASAARTMATGLEALARAFARSLARSAPLRCAFAPPFPAGPSPASAFDAVRPEVVEADVVELDAVVVEVVEVVDIVLVVEVALDVDPDGDAGRAERAGGEGARDFGAALAAGPPRAAGGAFRPGACEVLVAGDRRFEADRGAGADAFDPLPADPFPADEACAARPGGAASAPVAPTVAVSPSAARMVARTATTRNPPLAVVTRTFVPPGPDPRCPGCRHPGYRPSPWPG
jgi:hypothetical protein